MVKRAKKLVVLSMASLLAISNAMPAFATTNNLGTVQTITQDNIFRAAGIEWNLKHDAAKYMKYLGGNREPNGKGFMALFGADNTTPGNVYGENYVVMLRVDAGQDLSVSGLDSKTIADVMGQTFTNELKKAFEESVKKAGKTPIYGGANSSFACKYDPSEYWFYSGNSMSVSGNTEKVEVAVVGTVKGSSVYMILCACDGNGAFGKQLNVDNFTDIKISGSQVISNTFNGVVANSEADVAVGNVSLDDALNGVASGDVSVITGSGNNGSNAGTPVTASGTAQTSTKGHTYKVPVNAVAKSSGGYLYWSKADQNTWKTEYADGGSEDITFTFADSAAFNDNAWDNFNTSADFHTFYKKLLNNAMSDRVNETETLVDGRGRTWTVYYSSSANSYVWGAAVADNIDGVTVAVECTMFGQKTKNDMKARLTDALTGVK